ncbi:EF-hand calcium-binding domain-containing protein 6-like isoform X2 [Dendronephthya gigantea]|uniref:EF-hand calcium-binding domain-containing protein 6-like isoform X2 n=1 Tax=Dendronephthya gigantea TaxID=151771 RepID=UPI00106B58DD|nr:EF-hand calcium-binding domain-containing protein 6-like isoform X2 [Dendronephthya gigantea]
MANVVVRQAIPELNCLRPTSRGLSVEKRAAGSRERSRSLEPQTRIPKTRFKTPTESAIESPKLSEVEVEKMIVEGSRQNLPTLKQVFKTLDIFNNGTVTQGEFSQVLCSYCNTTVPPHHLAKFFQKLGVNRDGTVSYARFITKYLANAESTNDRKAFSPGSPSKDDFETKLKLKLRGQYTAIVKAMKLFDYCQDGFIQKQELRRVLENFCFRLTDMQFERMWAKYGKASNGSMLNYMEFLEELGATKSALQEGKPSQNGEKRSRPTHTLPTSPISPPPENYIEQTFKEKFLANYETIYRAVMVLDHRAIGYVPLTEFKKVIVKHTVPMSDTLFHSLLQRCGITISHRIHYERFIDYYGKAQTNILWQPESTTTQEDIFNALQSHINSSFTSIKDAFLEFDYNKDGKISRSELRRIVEKFSFRLSEEDYARFMARVDPEHKGYISYHRFLEIFENKHSNKYGHPHLKDQNIPKQVSPPSIKTWSTVEEILRNKIKDNWQSVANAFIDVDTNRDGCLSRNELRKLLERYCLPLTDDHFEMLWSLSDENKDGKISFNEFLNKLGVDIISSDLHGYSKKITDESEAREQFMKQDQHVRRDRGPAQITARQAIGILRNYVMQKSTDLRKMFVKFDSNNDGEISDMEFRKVLESLGLAISDREFEVLCTHVGFLNGTLLYNKFIKHFQGARSENNRSDTRRFEVKEVNISDVLFSAEEAEARIKSKLQQNFSGLREAFYKFDDNHDGQVTRGEFRRVLKLFMITMTDSEFDRLLNKIQFGPDETLNYRDFLKRFEKAEKVESHGWLMGKREAKSASDVGHVTAEQADEIIKTKATQQWEDLSRAFRNFDEDGNGIVTKAELKNILYRYQLSLTQQEFDKLWNRYDTDRNGYVDYKEFIAKLGVEFASGDTDGHSRRIIDESYDTIMPEFKNKYKENERRSKEVVEDNQVARESHRPLTTDVDKKLKEIVLSRFYKFVKALVEADTKHDGSVTRTVLHKIINANGLQLSNHQMNQVWNTFGLNENGTIQYKDFLSIYTTTNNSPQRGSTKSSNVKTPQKFHTRVRSAPLSKPSTPYGAFSSSGKRNLSVRRSTPAARPKSAIKILTPPGYAKEIEKRIKDKVCDKWRDLETNFMEYDVMNSGVVSFQAFKDVLFDCNVPLTPDEIRVLGRKYEVGNTGSISYMGFLRSFLEDQVREPIDKTLSRSKLQPTRILYSPGKTNDQLLALIARLRHQIRHDWKSLRRSFKALDQQANGTCSTLAFRHILRKYNIELTEEEFYHLTTYYDKNVNGRIPYNEFIGAHLD